MDNYHKKDMFGISPADLDRMTRESRRKEESRQMADAMICLISMGALILSIITAVLLQL